MSRLSGSQRLADIGVRFLYMGAAIAMLWVAVQAGRDVRFAQGATPQLEFSETRWLAWVGAGVLSGVMAGLAVRPLGRDVRGYRVGVATALAVPPAALLFVWYSYFTGLWLPPEWALELAVLADAAPGVLVGLAIVAGLTAREPLEPA